MSSRIRRILLLLMLSLICSQAFGSETSSPVSRRQKRGIMKMMMHIMWDPVRLIRYWYAYDVTKEIAKSWRKILPTMMLLPFNPNAANTPGIAKYVHPSHGLAKHHKNTKQFAYPAVASGETYSASQFSKNFFLTDPSSKDTYSQFPSDAGIIFEGPRKPAGSESSTNLDSVPAVFQQYGGPQGGDGNIYMSSFPVMADGLGSSNEDQHQAVFHPVPKGFSNIYHHGQGLEPSKNQPGVFSGEHPDMKAMPFPYIIGIPHTSREEVIFKASSGEVPDFSEEKRDSDTVPSSTNTDSTRTKNGYLKFSSEHPNYSQFQPDLKSYMNYEGDQKDGQRPISHVVHAGHQELHIVLHPIPIGDTNLPPQATNGKALHFVPVDLNSNKSVISQFPFLFPTATRNSDPDGSHERQSSAPPDDDEEFYPSNNSSGKTRKTERVKNESKHGHKKVDEPSSSSEISDTRQSTRVTWVLKPSRRKDTKYFDNDSESSIPRISSVNFNKDGRDGELQDKHPLLLNGQSIDLVQLKEDLRHGTPVLIPFNKRTPFSPKPSENPVDFVELNSYDRFAQGKESMRKESAEVEEISAERPLPQTFSLEQYDAYDEKNSTQKFILFLKRHPPYNHREN